MFSSPRRDNGILAASPKPNTMSATDEINSYRSHELNIGVVIAATARDQTMHLAAQPRHLEQACRQLPTVSLLRAYSYVLLSEAGRKLFGLGGSIGASLLELTQVAVAGARNDDSAAWTQNAAALLPRRRWCEEREDDMHAPIAKWELVRCTDSKSCAALTLGGVA